ncbi:hypothetical protein JTB14_019785 [Gonioctena quinquepunctata]|nr:hypothetical protein JTB14_019785 [Gonioctena quinquepunctata]
MASISPLVLSQSPKVHIGVAVRAADNGDGMLENVKKDRIPDWGIIAVVIMMCLTGCECAHPCHLGNSGVRYGGH